MLSLEDAVLEQSRYEEALCTPPAPAPFAGIPPYRKRTPERHSEPSQKGGRGEGVAARSDRASGGV